MDHVAVTGSAGNVAVPPPRCAVRPSSCARGRRRQCAPARLTGNAGTDFPPPHGPNLHDYLALRLLSSSLVTVPPLPGLVPEPLDQGPIIGAFWSECQQDLRFLESLL